MEPVFNKNDIHDILTAQCPIVTDTVHENEKITKQMFSEASSTACDVVVSTSGDNDADSLIVDLITTEESISKTILYNCLKFRLNTCIDRKIKVFKYTHLTDTNVPNLKPLREVLTSLQANVFTKYGNGKGLILDSQEKANAAYIAINDFCAKTCASKQELARDIFNDKSLTAHDYEVFTTHAYNYFRGDKAAAKQVVLNVNDMRKICQSLVVHPVIKSYEDDLIATVKIIRTLFAKLPVPVSGNISDQVKEQMVYALEKLRKDLFCYVYKYIFKANLVYAAKSDAISELVDAIVDPNNCLVEDPGEQDSVPEDSSTLEEDNPTLLLKEEDIDEDILDLFSEEMFDDAPVTPYPDDFNPSLYVMQAEYAHYNNIFESAMRKIRRMDTLNEAKAKTTANKPLPLGKKAVPENTVKAVPTAMTTIRKLCTSRIFGKPKSCVEMASIPATAKDGFISGKLEQIKIASYDTSKLPKESLKEFKEDLVSTVEAVSLLLMNNFGCRAFVTESKDRRMNTISGDIYIQNRAGLFEAENLMYWYGPLLITQEADINQMAQNAANAIKNKASNVGADAGNKLKHLWAAFLNFMKNVMNHFQTSMDTRIKNGIQFLNANTETIKKNLPNMQGQISMGNYQQGINAIRNTKMPPIQTYLTDIDNGKVAAVEDIEGKVFPQYNPKNNDGLSFVDYAKIQFVGGANKTTVELNSLPVDEMINFCKDNSGYTGLVNSINNDLTTIDQAVTQKIQALEQKADQAKQQQATQQQQQQNQQNNQPNANQESELQDIKDYLAAYLEDTPPANGQQQQAAQPPKPPQQPANNQNQNGQQNNGNNAVKNAMSSNIVNPNGTHMATPQEKSPEQQAIANLNMLAANYQTVLKFVNTAKITAYENIYVNYMNALRTIAAASNKNQNQNGQEQQNNGQQNNGQQQQQSQQNQNNNQQQ